MAGRQRRRGPRLWDPALVAWSIPWVLAMSAIQTVLLGPVLLAAAVEAVAVTTTPLHGTHPPSAWAAAMMSLHGVHLPSAWPAVAAVYTALSYLGSPAARRELHRVLDAVTSSPLEMVMTVLIVAAIAVIIAALALIQPSSLWPLPDPLIIHTHIPGLHLVRLHA